jgi:hypothetical protein
MSLSPATVWDFFLIVLRFTDLPDMARPRNKNISVFPKCKSLYQSICLTRQEGRLAIVTNVRWDAVDARAATDERG